MELGLMKLRLTFAPKKQYKASALDYKQLNELITEACQLEDPTFLYIVVMSMTQGLRRGELCGLMWKDINWETKRVTICQNRVQLVTNDTVKLPKREKVREIELHKAGYDTLKLYNTEEYMMTELERATKRAQKQQRLEKAKQERLKGNPPEDILVEYESVI